MTIASWVLLIVVCIVTHIMRVYFDLVSSTLNGSRIGDREMWGADDQYMVLAIVQLMRGGDVIKI